MKPKGTGIALALLVLVAVGLAGSSCTASDRALQFAGFERFMDSLMAEHDVPGVAFAAFDDKEMLYHHVAGYKNQETQEPVTGETAFEAASISKPLFAYIVLTLARDGILDLDQPLGDLPTDLSALAADPRSAVLTPRMLLTHLGGLPNWRARMNFGVTRYEDMFSEGDTLQFVVDPNTNYRYSGEGYVLLQRVVEQKLGRSLNDVAQELIFGPLGMSRSSFVYDEHIRTNVSRGHRTDMTPDKFDIALALASTTLHTTASDLAAFGIHLARGMRDGQYYSAMADTAVTVVQIGGVGRSWGLGLGVVLAVDGKYVYHGGNNVVFIADFIYGLEENLGYVLLTNSANGPALVEAVERRMFGTDIQR